MKNTYYQNDGFVKKAKQMGYRARSAFKLQEIQEKYRLVKKGDVVLDLGAAPGSFIQYLIGIVGKDGLIIGIDSEPINKIERENVLLIKKDIFQIKPAEIYQKFRKKKQKIDVITADLSPKISGLKEVDRGKSIELNEKVIELSKKLQKPNGIIVTKIFQGTETEDFISQIRTEFKKIKRFKPKASRKESQEIFLILQKK